MSTAPKKNPDTVTNYVNEALSWMREAHEDEDERRVFDTYATGVRAAVCSLENENATARTALARKQEEVDRLARALEHARHPKVAP